MRAERVVVGRGGAPCRPAGLVRVWAALLGAMAGHAEGAEVDPVRLSLAECVQIALEDNLELKIARLGPVEAREALAYATASAYEPNVSISGSTRSSSSPGGLDDQNRAYLGSETDRQQGRLWLEGDIPTGGSVSISSSVEEVDGTRTGSPFQSAAGSAVVQVRQPLLRNLWIDRERLQIAVGKSQIEMASLSWKSAIMQLINRVEVAYYDLILAHEEVKTREYALRLTERLASDNRKRVEVGRMAEWDEKQAAAGLSERRSSLVSAQGNLREREYALKRLLSDDIAQWVDVALVPSDGLDSAGTVLPDLQWSWQHGLSLRPDLLRMRERLRLAKVELRYTHNQTFPQLDLVGSYGRIGSGDLRSDALAGIREGSSPTYALDLVLSVPLLGGRAAKASHRMKRIGVERDLAELNKLEQDVMVEIAVAVQAVQTALAQIEATEQARVFAEEALEAEQRKLAVGLTTTFNLLELQGRVIERRLAEQRAQAEYHRSVATLALREGSVLARHGFEF